MNEKKPEDFDQKGALADQGASSSSSPAESDSLANSSVYTALMDDFDAVQLFLAPKEGEEEDE